jgi:hypothetical protein
MPSVAQVKDALYRAANAVDPDPSNCLCGLSQIGHAA